MEHRRLNQIQQHLSPSLYEDNNNNNVERIIDADAFERSVLGVDDAPLSLENTSGEVFGNGGITNNRQQYKKRTAVIVAGARTPFLRSFGEAMQADAIDLGVAAVGGLIKKTKLDPNHIDEIIMGQVVMNTAAPNLAREIIIDLNLPKTIPGVSVSRACLSGLQAIMQAVAFIENGNADCIIAGGSDSTSNGEMPLPRHVTHALANWQYGKKKGLAGLMQFFKDAGSPVTWIPSAPKVAERSTGKTMGYHADLMAEINKISRAAQDEFAIASHTKAAAARKAGKFADEIVPLKLRNGKTITQDNLIRENQDRAKAAQLKPVFRKATCGGSVTAASSSPLTDGASAVLVMSEEKAIELGYPTDIVMRAFCNTAIDPFPQLLLAPALAIPKCLELAGLTIDDIDIFEIHEAFAAQVLSTTAVLASAEFAKKRLNRDTPVGVIPPHKINPNGGSIAIGHPFAATGGRCVTSAMNELRRTKKRFALISICAAGGLGGVAILERRDTTTTTTTTQQPTTTTTTPNN